MGSARQGQRADRTGLVLALTAVLLALCASLYFAFVPAVHETVDHHSRDITLIESDGSTAVRLLMAPVAIAALPLLGKRKPSPRLAILSAVALLVFSFLSWTTGPLYLPSAFVALVLAVWIY